MTSATNWGNLIFLCIETYGFGFMEDFNNHFSLMAMKFNLRILTTFQLVLLEIVAMAYHTAVWCAIPHFRVNVYYNTPLETMPETIRSPQIEVVIFYITNEHSKVCNLNLN